MNRMVLEKMLAEGKDSALLRYTLGSICLKEDLFDAAAEHLRQAVQLDPNHSASWKGYGTALMKLKRNQDAMRAYETGMAAAKNKGDIQAVKEMGVFLKRLKKMEDSA